MIVVLTVGRGLSADSPSRLESSLKTQKLKIINFIIGSRT